MTEKNGRKSAAILNNPIVKAVGTQKIVVLLVLVVLFLLFSVLSPAFRSYTTLITLLSYSYYIAFMAIGATFVIITGELICLWELECSAMEFWVERLWWKEAGRWEPVCW